MPIKIRVGAGECEPRQAKPGKARQDRNHLLPLLFLADFAFVVIAGAGGCSRNTQAYGRAVLIFLLLLLLLFFFECSFELGGEGVVFVFIAAVGRDRLDSATGVRRAEGACVCARRAELEFLDIVVGHGDVVFVFVFRVEAHVYVGAWLGLLV